VDEKRRFRLDIVLFSQNNVDPEVPRTCRVGIKDESGSNVSGLYIKGVV